MKNNKCLASPESIRRFMENTEANWRASLYISCTCCKYERPDGCGDFLYVPDVASSRPVLLPIPDADIIFSHITDRSECLGIMSNLIFLELFRKWFRENHPIGDVACPLISCAKFVQKIL